MPATRETKPGIYTTEFWITIFTNLAALVDIAGADYLNTQNRYVVLAVAVVNGLYAVSRGRAKQGIPFEPPVPPAA